MKFWLMLQPHSDYLCLWGRIMFKDLSVLFCRIWVFDPFSVSFLISYKWNIRFIINWLNWQAVKYRTQSYVVVWIIKVPVTSSCWHSRGLLKIIVNVSSTFNKWLFFCLSESSSFMLVVKKAYFNGSTLLMHPNTDLYLICCIWLMFISTLLEPTGNQ